MKNIKKFDDFINENGYFESDYQNIPEETLNHWLYHYDLWCKDNNQIPEYNDVDELIGNQEAIDHVYYHAAIYAKEHDFKLDGHEYMEEDEDITESILEGKISDVEHIGHGLKYHNEIFGSFNSPKKYEGKGKHKWRVLAKEGDKVKVINFGKRDDIKKEDLTRLSKKYWEHFWK